MAGEYFLALIALSLLLVLILVIFWTKSKTSPQEIAQEIFIEGLMALASGDEKLAYQKFHSVVQQDTENVDAYLKLGDLLRKRGRPEKALRIHRELLIRPSLSESKRLQVEKSLADDYVTAGQFEKAAEVWEALWKKERESAETGEKLISAYERLGKWESAVEVDEKLTRLKGALNSPRSALYMVMQGRQEAEKENYHQARVALKEALRYDEKCVPAYLYLGEAYVADGRLDEAVEYWKKSLELVPSAGHLIYPRLEKALFDLGKYGEIIKIYLDILEKNPQEIHTLHALAGIYQKKGNSNLAIETLKEILEIKPDYYPALGSLILLFSQNGRSQEAKALVEEYQGRISSPEDKLSCHNCGQTFSSPPWRCPSCGRINVYLW
jgi:lipopolysaccharide biosynthesis regulator YciM